MKLETRLGNEDLFDQLEGEKQQKLDKESYTEKGILQQLIEGFETVFSKKPLIDYGVSIDPYYKYCLQNTPKKYTNKEVNEFLAFYALQEMKRESKMRERLESKLGIYTSALINNSDQYQWVIEIPFVESVRHGSNFDGIENIGYKNNGKEIIIKGQGFPLQSIGGSMIQGKIIIEHDRINKHAHIGGSMKGGEIVINGKGGYCIGHEMKGGLISVVGDVISVGFFMEGGSITIKGNVKQSVGWQMEGGEIYIEGSESINGREIGQSMKSGKISITGNTNGRPGHEMQGGKIHLHGKQKYFRIPKSARGGNIYRNGKLVMKNGWVVKTPKKIDTCKNPVLEKMLGEFIQEDLIIKGGNKKIDPFKSYAKCLEHITFQYTSEDIEQFSLHLGQYQSIKHFSTRFGLYLSALINSIKEVKKGNPLWDCCNIHTNHLEKPETLEYIGFRNNKKLRVEGNGGKNLGYEAESNWVIVEGNVEENCGINLKGGEIRVRGNAKRNLGKNMERGSIVVSRDAYLPIHGGNEGVITVRGGLIPVPRQ